jgi:hypothetical protein
MRFLFPEFVFAIAIYLYCHLELFLVVDCHTMIYVVVDNICFTLNDRFC